MRNQSKKYLNNELKFDLTQPVKEQGRKRAAIQEDFVQGTNTNVE
jgi:hypothetical protein